MSHTPESPFNDLPPALVALAVVIVGIELIFQIGSYGLIGGTDAIGWRLFALEKFAFFDAVFDDMRNRNFWPLEHVRRFLSYAFVHGSVLHAIMVSVFILAFGKMVGEHFGNLAVIILFFVCSLTGSLSYGLLLNTEIPLAGGYPAAFGFLGAYTFLLWIGLTAMGRNALDAFRLIGFLIAIRLGFGIFYGLQPDLLSDVVGFATGFVLAAALVPGAIPRLIEKLRRR